MTRQVYDLCGANDIRFSPYCWRTRMALAHKRLDAEFVAWHFTEQERLQFSGSRTVPVLVDGDEVISDSWRIAHYLETTYVEVPSLFGGESGAELTGFTNAWADAVLVPAVARCVIGDILGRIEPKDQAYFRASREERFGLSLEQMTERRPESVPLSRCGRGSRTSDASRARTSDDSNAPACPGKAPRSPAPAADNSSAASAHQEHAPTSIPS